MSWTHLLAAVASVAAVGLVILLIGNRRGNSPGIRRAEVQRSRVGDSIRHTVRPVTIDLGPARSVSQASLGLSVPVGRIRRGSPLNVHRRSDPLWTERGWRKQGNAYVGHWMVAGRRWRGRIDIPYPGGFQALIWDPPLRELLFHRHRPCFQSSGVRGRYRVHFSSMPSSVDHAIANIEQILREAVRSR